MAEDLAIAARDGERVAGAPHFFDLRVYWEDTDAAGIVYYANYLRYIERARSDLVRGAGIDQTELLAADGLTFQVRRCDINYLSPARLDDALRIATSVEAIGAATIDMRQLVSRDRTPLIDAAIRLACVNTEGKPRRVPAPVRRKLSAYLPLQEDI